MAKGDCVPEEVPLGDSVALPLPEALPVIVAVGVSTRETLAVSETETVPLAEGDSLSAGVEVAVEDGDWLDDLLSDLDMLELVLVEPDAVPDIDDEELAEEDPETVSLGVLDSLELWLPLSVEESVDVSVEDLLREWEEERLLLNDSDEDGLIASDKVGEPLDVWLLVGEPLFVGDSLLDELEEGVAKSDCVSEDVPLPEVLAVMVEVPLNEALGVSDKETVTLEDGVDVSLDDSLRELDGDPVLLGVPVELADGDSDELDDPVDEAERLPLPDEVTELLREALSVPEPDDVSLAE